MNDTGLRTKKSAACFAFDHHKNQDFITLAIKY